MSYDFSADGLPFKEVWLVTTLSHAEQACHFGSIFRWVVLGCCLSTAQTQFDRVSWTIITPRCSFYLAGRTFHLGPLFYFAYFGVLGFGFGFCLRHLTIISLTSKREGTRKKLFVERISSPTSCYWRDLDRYLFSSRFKSPPHPPSMLNYSR